MSRRQERWSWQRRRAFYGRLDRWEERQKGESEGGYGISERKKDEDEKERDSTGEGQRRGRKEDDGRRALIEREVVVGTDGEGTGHGGKEGEHHTLPRDTHSRDVAVGTHCRAYARMPVHTFLVFNVPLSLRSSKRLLSFSAVRQSHGARCVSRDIACFRERARCHIDRARAERSTHVGESPDACSEETREKHARRVNRRAKSMRGKERARVERAKVRTREKRRTKGRE